VSISPPDRRRRAGRSYRRPERRHTGPGCAGRYGAVAASAPWGDHRHRCAGKVPRAAASPPRGDCRKQQRRRMSGPGRLVNRAEPSMSLSRTWLLAAPSSGRCLPERSAGQRCTAMGEADQHDVMGAVTWRGASTAWPVRGSHNRTVPSLPAVASSLPSGLNATPSTPPKVRAPPGENATPAGGHGRICGG
jgi:hypothetical protein